jgi:ppGpp synthetase/RelA/SpoT-type nucleotidyltranferase
MTIEKFNLTEEELKFIRERQVAHNYLYGLFLGELTQIQSDYEIFRRTPEGRIKTFSSIMNAFQKREDEMQDLKTFIVELKDIAGLRLTIATKDEYPHATEILVNNEDLKILGKLDTTSRQENGETNSRGYFAYHYYLHTSLDGIIEYLDYKLNSDIDDDAKANFNNCSEMMKGVRVTESNLQLIAELQIRTLAQDLWAVFEHPERYKNQRRQSSPAIDQELLNYSKLMQVADDIAQLVKNRKKYDAENYLKVKIPDSPGEKNILNIENLSKTLSQDNIFKNSLKGLSLLHKCDLLIYLADNNVFTTEDLKLLIENKEYFQIISNAIKNLEIPLHYELKVEVSEMIKMFCACKKSDRDCRISTDQVLDAEEISRRKSIENKRLLKLLNDMLNVIWTECEFSYKITDYGIK